MKDLETQLRRSRFNPISMFGGLLIAIVVFVSMGLTQLGIEFEAPVQSEPLATYHLPPPPPPPPAKTPPKPSTVSINFNVPVTNGPADVPLGFLNVDFGLSPKKLTKTTVGVADTVESFKTDGLQDLEIYDFADVTEKPVVKYGPMPDIPAKAINFSKKPVEFTYICRIDTRGRVLDVHILDADYPDAIPYFIEWVKRKRYTPAKKDGKRVSCVVQRKVTYHPSTSSSPFSL